MSLARPPSRPRASLAGTIGRLVVILLLVALVGAVGWALSVRGNISSVETVDRELVAPGNIVVITGLTDVHLQTLGGAGPPVMLIHDFDLAGGYQWQPLAESLSSHRLLVPDLVDFGYSARPGDTGRLHTIVGQAETMLALLEEIQVSRVSVVGAGIGGSVAAQMAALAPDVIDRLVLIAPEIYGPAQSWSSLLFRLPLVGQAMTFTFFGAGAQADTRYLTGCDAGGYCPDSEARAARAVAARVTGTAQALFARLQTPPASTLPDAVSSITARTLILWGDRDAITPLVEGETLTGTIPGASLLILPGTGHRPHLEDPAATGLLIADFLAG
jgi:pimeloyl-ACP methyl ester carboxylesterase